MKEFKTGQHFPIIDLLRGIAALGVAFYHTAHFRIDGKFWLEEWPALREISTYGPVGVRMFFVISGFVIPWYLFSNQYKLSLFPKFLARRWLRIEPPFIASIFLFLIGRWAYTQYSWYAGPEFNFPWTAFFENAFYLSEWLGKPWINEIYWSLAIEFQYYLLIGLLFLVFIKANRSLNLLVLAAMIAADFAFTFQGFVLSYGSMFAVGIATFLFKVGKLKSPEFLLFVLLGSISSGWNGYMQLPFAEGLAVGLTALAIAYLNWNTRLGKLLGMISFSLYLTHGFSSGEIIFRSWPWLWSPIRRILFFFVAIAGEILFAWLFYKLLEGPFHRISKRVKLG